MYVCASDFCSITSGKPGSGDRFTVCDTPVLHTQNGFGPVRLMTIAHAFNYRVAVLRDGVRLAVRVGRSRKAETCFLKDVNIPWGQQVTVMFQIVSTLMEEVPAFALRMRELRGEQPNVQLVDNPWGHVENCVAPCNCLDSDRTGAYVHCLIPRTGLADSTPRDDVDVSEEGGAGFTLNFYVKF